MKPLRAPLLGAALALLAAAPARGQEGDTARVDTVPAPDSAAAPARRWPAPFAVQSSGRVPTRPLRPTIVYLDPAPRDTVRPDTLGADTAAAPDSARADTAAPPPRRTPPRTAARDSARAPATPPRTPATPPRTPAAPARPRTHTVAAGETWLGIARRYRVTSDALRAANPTVEWERVRTGTVLRVPAAGAAVAATPSTGRTGTTTTRPPAAPAGSRRHVVARGETLYGIARRYGVRPEAIRTANRMTDDAVRAGATLIIPPAR